MGEMAGQTRKPFHRHERWDDQDARCRALLLHYAGERVYDIYDAEKGEGPWSFKETSEVLTKYFKPKTNIQIEIFTFRSCTQKPGQSLDDFVTELRTLSRNCGFGNVDHDILCQLTQHCRSNRLRRRALPEPDKSLADILELGRTLELADTQASLMEKDSRQEEAVNDVHHGKGRPSRSYPDSQKCDRFDFVCNRCASNTPHTREHRCPALGKVCNYCKVEGHFRSVCFKLKRKDKSRDNAATTKVNAVADHTAQADSDDSSDEYSYEER